MKPQYILIGLAAVLTFGPDGNLITQTERLIMNLTALVLLICALVLIKLERK
jgi:hypothetical protein